MLLQICEVHTFAREPCGLHRTPVLSAVGAPRRVTNDARIETPRKRFRGSIISWMVVSSTISDTNRSGRVIMQHQACCEAYQVPWGRALHD